MPDDAAAFFCRMPRRAGASQLSHFPILVDYYTGLHTEVLTAINSMQAFICAQLYDVGRYEADQSLIYATLILAYFDRHYHDT